MQRNKQVAVGRKKFNMDPKKVGMFTHGRPLVVGSGAMAHLGR